jgi:transcriptional regulator GlxA family with amidase domain
MAQVRHQRAMSALVLLTGSSLPIAAIAARVGVPDAQAFNKMGSSACCVG